MLRKRHPLFNEAGNEGGVGGSPAPAPPAPETFSATYVKELRQESAGYRLRAQAAEKEKEAAAEAAAKASKEAEEKIAAAATAANARLIRAEIKAIALKAGIVDVDGLALADLSNVKFDDKGDLVGGEEAIDALRKSKPYLFTKTTSSTGSQPPPAGSKGGDKKTAKDMTDAEWAAEKKKLGIR
jgi:hypothetical protein